MTKRFRWILVGLVIGLVMGGVGYAVVVNPPNSSDRYYACVSNVGVVRAGTVRLNAPPTKCPNALDQIHSWNAAGSTGATGESGATGPIGATGEPGPAGGSELGAYVGRYAATFTASGCAPGELRIKIHTVDGQTPVADVGACSPLRDYFGQNRPAVSPGQTFGSQIPLAWLPEIDTETLFGVAGRTEALVGSGLGTKNDCWAISTGPAVKLSTSCSNTYDGSSMDLIVNTPMVYEHSAPLAPTGQMLLFAEFLPAGSPVPDISQFQPPPAALLPQFAVFTNP